MSNETKNLIQGLCEEIDRVKEIVKEYESIPSGAGNFAAIFMKQDISMAEKARNKKERKEIKNSFTDKEYNLNKHYKQSR